MIAMTKVTMSLPYDLAVTLDRRPRGLVPFSHHRQGARLSSIERWSLSSTSYVDEESDADRELTDAVMAASGDYFMKTPW